MSVMPPEDSMQCVGFTSDVVQVTNTTLYYIPKVIKYCKQIEAFKQLKPTDQYVLLKSFFSEVTATYCAFNYCPEGGHVTLVLDESKNQVIKHKILNVKNHILPSAILIHKAYSQMNSALENDILIRNLVIAMILFKPRDNTSCPEFINYTHSVICRLLWKYLIYKFKHKAEHKFRAILEALNGLNGSSCFVVELVTTCWLSIA